MNAKIFGRNTLTSGLVVLLFFFLGCGGNPYTETDTPTRGTIKVAIDDSYRLFMESEIYAFETIYKYAKIDTLYVSEADAFDLFMKDSVPLIVVNRTLNDQELRILESQQIVPKTTKIAIDAVALIVNNENPLEDLPYDMIKGFFSGEITRWNQIDPNSRLGDVKVVFDHYKSANPRYFKELFELDSLPPSCYAVESNPAVINFVERNPSSIGVISVNWISDRRDSVSNDFLNRIKVAGISAPGNSGPDANYYQPYQAYMADGSYPFLRNVYCINRQTYSGLAFGLSAYIAGDKGQLIILHSGLVPATQPIRIVEIKR